MIIDLEEKIKSKWNEVEKREKKPSEIRKIKEIEYKEFVDLFENSNFNNLEKLIENFYSGDVYSIKNSFSLKFIEKIKSYLINNFKETNSEFYKIKEGCPNFHRVVGEKEKFKYKLKSNRHDYYFFPWNRSKEKIDLFHYFYPKWRLIKLLSGLKSNEYEKNTPKDGVVDRLLFRTYPNKSGYLQPHTDPPIIRIISGLTMSKKGIDFDTGGIYFFRNNKPFDIESFFEVGDISLFYQTMKHGVEKILTNTKITKTEGRWWGCFSNPMSDEVERTEVQTGY